MNMPIRSFDSFDGHTVRKIAEDLPPRQAVDYLLGVLEQISWLDMEKPHPTDKISARRSERRVLRALYDAHGACVGSDYLLTVCSVHRPEADQLPQSKVVAVHICNLRKSLPKGWKIRSVWGVGYRLDRPEA